MSTSQDLTIAYHQQDTSYYCGAACAQMVLDSVGAGLLGQNPLYADNHSHSTIEPGWATGPDGLQWTLNHYAPAAPAGAPHYGAYNFTLFALGNEDTTSRKIIWTIHHYQVSPVALVYHSQHWVVVRGYTASAAPASYSDVSYSIDSFDINNPWPPVPSEGTPSLAPPPPHTNGTDGCGSGGDRGLVDENISYSAWQSTYMTGASGGYWNGKFVTVADPAPAPKERGKASRPLLEPLQNNGELITGQQAIERAELSLKAYGLTERKNYRAALANTKFSEPLLVQRLDHPDTFYHVTPATDGSVVPLAVATDAKTGIYLQSAVHAEPNQSIFTGMFHQLQTQYKTQDLHEQMVRYIADKHIELPEQRGRITVRPELISCSHLVWKPCRESLSPFYPFYMFTVGADHVYVRVDGAIFTELHDTERGI
jgi:hypothetical protein